MKKRTTKKRDWSGFWAVVGGIGGPAALVAIFVLSIALIEPDRSWCTNYPKAYTKASAAEYVDGIGCIITDTTGEKMPSDAFDRKYYS